MRDAGTEEDGVPMGMMRVLVLFAFQVFLSTHVAAETPAPPASVYEIANFKPIALGESKAETVDLVVSDELERTPRHYLRINASARAEGAADLALVVVDMLRREYRGQVVHLAEAGKAEVAVDFGQIGRPVGMLRGVRMYHSGGPVAVSSLQVTCADELLPPPDATVKGPLDDSSIQKALDSLSPRGGIVYIPGGTIPCETR